MITLEGRQLICKRMHYFNSELKEFFDKKATDQNTMQDVNIFYDFDDYVKDIIKLLQDPRNDFEKLFSAFAEQLKETFSYIKTERGQALFHEKLCGFVSLFKKECFREMNESIYEQLAKIFAATLSSEELDHIREETWEKLKSTYCYLPKKVWTYAAAIFEMASANTDDEMDVTQVIQHSPASTTIFFSNISSPVNSDNDSNVNETKPKLENLSASFPAIQLSQRFYLS